MEVVYTDYRVNISSHFWSNGLINIHFTRHRNEAVLKYVVSDFIVCYELCCR